jgi:hypothetical protein
VSDSGDIDDRLTMLVRVLLERITFKPEGPNESLKRGTKASVLLISLRPSVAGAEAGVWALLDAATASINNTIEQSCIAIRCFFRYVFIGFLLG